VEVSAVEPVTSGDRPSTDRVRALRGIATLLGNAAPAEAEAMMSIQSLHPTAATSSVMENQAGGG